MIAVDHPDTVLQDVVFVFDALIRRQATLAFTKRHGSPAGVEPNAEITRGLDLVVDLVAALKKVGMVKDCGAARQGKFGKTNQRTCARGIRIGARPDPVMGLQPRKQIVVLGSRQIARQCLVEMMMRVHETGQNDLSGRVDHLCPQSPAVHGDGPTAVIKPSSANRPPFSISRRPPSMVTRTSAFFRSSVRAIRDFHDIRISIRMILTAYTLRNFGSYLKKANFFKC